MKELAFASKWNVLACGTLWYLDFTVSQLPKHHLLYREIYSRAKIASLICLSSNYSDYSRTPLLLEWLSLVVKNKTMTPWGPMFLFIVVPNFDTKHLVSTFYTYSPLLWEARGPGGLNTIHHLSLALSSVKEKFFCRLSQSSLHFPLVEAKFFFHPNSFPCYLLLYPGQRQHTVHKKMYLIIV